MTPKDPSDSRAQPGRTGSTGERQAWLCGESAALRAFEHDLERVAGADVPVLLEGESGSGKNLAARELHARSGRAAGPLVEVDLSALTSSLIEAELFGHEVGAFTGAARARAGRFVRAAGGTLVLDGVERLSEGLQGKLLRVLQERVVEPLGSEGTVSVDVRVVATCTGSLLDRVRERRFRDDLYYRLAVVRILVPALRERSGDVPAIARGLVQRISARAAVPPRALSSSALARLESHAWPGNLRELENALERVLVLSRAGGGDVTAEEFGFLLESVAGVPERLAREALAHGITLERFETALLDEALRETRGNVTGAARLAGLTRRAFELRHARRARGEPAPEEDA